MPLAKFLLGKGGLRRIQAEHVDDDTANQREDFRRIVFLDGAGIWKQLGIDAIVRQQADTRHLGFDVERALFALIANRACAPASKLHCHEQWLKEDAHIDGTQELKLHQLYRAMDFLEANKDVRIRGATSGMI